VLARAARSVLRWEGAARARVEITLLDAAAMRRLNRRATGRRGLTDVIAYALPQADGTLVGDVYLCPIPPRCATSCCGSRCTAPSTCSATITPKARGARAPACGVARSAT
jgi:hypothetical protein